MRLQWIQDTGSPRLLLVFLGWGMDPAPVAHLIPVPGEDTGLLWDYRDLTLPAGLAERCQRAEAVRVLAWSWGVWVCGTLQPHVLGPLGQALAVNGTLAPLDPDRGIRPRFLTSPVSDRTLPTVWHAMAPSGPARNAFQAALPGRVAHELWEERTQLTAAAAHLPVPFPFHHALISRRDQVIPPEAQLRQWEGQVPVTLLEAPHYPFHLWSSWEDPFQVVGHEH